LDGGTVFGRSPARRSAASSIPILFATTSFPIASTAASYITQARHIGLKFDGELFRLYVISAHASAPQCIIRSTHLLRMKPMLSPPGVGSDFRTHQGRPNGRVRRWASSGYWRWPSPAKAISPGGSTFRALALSANPKDRCGREARGHRDHPVDETGDDLRTPSLQRRIALARHFGGRHYRHRAFHQRDALHIGDLGEFARRRTRT
jgi:hypothetical protein